MIRYAALSLARWLVNVTGGGSIITPESRADFGDPVCKVHLTYSEGVRAAKDEADKICELLERARRRGVSP